MMEIGEGRRSERLRLIREKTFKQKQPNGVQHEPEKTAKKRTCKQLQVNNGGRRQSERLRIKRCKFNGGSEAASKFMSVVTDDLLQEILVRLPDSRSVIQCGSVCKRWFSLVSSRSSQYLYFIRKFNYHHRLKRRRQQEQKQEELPYTLLMTGNHISRGYRLQYYFHFYTIPRHHFLSDKSKILHHGHASTAADNGYLDFLPWRVEFILSSFDDLLLISITGPNLCICNPLTKQWILLPKIRYYSVIYRCGFVCKPSCTCNSQFGGEGSNSYCNCSIKYKVALISAVNWDSTTLIAEVFSSETGQWSKSAFQFSNVLFNWHETCVGNNGIMYWGFGNRDWRGIVAFNPFKDGEDMEEERCRLIGLPAEFVPGYAKIARIGVVRGRLRLLQFYFIKRFNTYVLKAWELDDDDDDYDRSKKASWDLVHDLCFERIDKSVVLFPVALHPDDGDVVFLTSSANGRTKCRDIFRYQIGSADVERVHKSRHSSCAFPLVHPWWPTTIPSLPSST